MMRRIALLGAAALLAACEGAPLPVAPEAPAPETAAAASMEWQQVTYDLVNYLPVECIGEPVALTGPITQSTRQVVDAHGTVHLHNRFDAGDVIATGLFSGRVWTTRLGVELFHFSWRPDGTPKLFSHQGLIRMEGAPGQPTLILEHFYQIVVDPSGEVRLERSTPDEFTCHFTGQDAS